MVLIGDGFAEGLGDWVVMGGMAGVTRMLEKQAGSDEKVCAVGVVCLFCGTAGVVYNHGCSTSARARVCVRLFCCTSTSILLVYLYHISSRGKRQKRVRESCGIVIVPLSV